MSARRTMAVAGATGNCGRAVLLAARAHGVRVRALARDPARLGSARDACDEVRVVDVTSPESLRGALDGVELVVSALGKTNQKDRIPRWSVDVQANANVFAEARRAGVARVGLVSLYGARADHPVEMVRMKGEAERLLEACGVPWTAFRPTGFFSDMWELFAMARRGTVWSLGDARLAFNPIALEDLGEFIVRSMLDGAAAGRQLPVGGPEVLSVREVAAAAERVLGRRVRVREVPLWLARALTGVLRPFSRDIWELAQFFVGNASELQELGGTLEAPRFGESRLEDYFRARWSRERAAAQAPAATG